MTPDLPARIEREPPSRELDAEIHRATHPEFGDMLTAAECDCAPGWLAGGNHPQPVLAPSYYVLNPDPLALMRAGGWSGLALVERYAHLLPSGHEEGIRRVWGGATVERRVRA